MLCLARFLDTSTYGTAFTLLYLGGFALWAPAYLAIVVRARRLGWLEIPLGGACGDVAWDFLSAFVFAEHLGWGVELFFGAAFTLDALLVAAILRWPAAGSVGSAVVPPRRVVRVAALSAIAGCAVLVWAFRHDRLDTALGTRSAYVVAVVLAAGYLWQAATLNRARALSHLVGWCKLVGDAMVSLFVLHHDPTTYGRLLAVVLTSLDVAYVVLLAVRDRRSP